MNIARKACQHAIRRYRKEPPSPLSRAIASQIQRQQLMIHTSSPLAPADYLRHAATHPPIAAARCKRHLAFTMVLALAGMSSLIAANLKPKRLNTHQYCARQWRDVLFVLSLGERSLKSGFRCRLCVNASAHCPPSAAGHLARRLKGRLKSQLCHSITD